MVIQKYTSVYRGKKPRILCMPHDQQSMHNLKDNSMSPPISTRKDGTRKPTLGQVLNLALQPHGAHVAAEGDENFPVARLQEDVGGN